jgi:hypothetical protein
MARPWADGAAPAVVVGSSAVVEVTADALLVFLLPLRVAK